MNPCWV